jgi:predicted nuclease of predicted toxin-antitoxin system
MKFLLDQDVYAGTARLLARLGHDALPVSKMGLSQAEDTELLMTARRESRVLVTRDRDFGGLVFVRDLGTGVIYLRMSPATQNAVHEELARVLIEHSEEELKEAFVVVEPGRHRFRKTSRPSTSGE